MKFDLNDYEAPSRDFIGSNEPIPDDEEVHVVLSINMGDDPDSDNVLTCSEKTAAKFLKCEFTVIGGPYNKRKFWENWVLSTDGEPSEGHAKAIQISATKVRAVVEAAREINSADNSPAAKKQRQIELIDLHDMEFDCVVGIERGKDGYPDRNCIKRVINPAEAGKPSTKVASKPKAPAGVVAANGAKKPPAGQQKQAKQWG